MSGPLTLTQLTLPNRLTRISFFMELPIWAHAHFSPNTDRNTDKGASESVFENHEARGWLGQSDKTLRCCHLSQPSQTFEVKVSPELVRSKWREKPEVVFIWRTQTSRTLGLARRLKGGVSLCHLTGVPTSGFGLSLPLHSPHTGWYRKGLMTLKLWLEFKDG